MSGQYAEQQKGDMKHLSAVPSPVSANATASGAPLYLCRASGDGSHSFRICADEAGVFAFYEEMFGKHHDGTIYSEIEHFRDPDNWAYEGTVYEVELYCAKWEVWKAEPQELRSPEAASALTTLTQQLDKHRSRMSGICSAHRDGEDPDCRICYPHPCISPEWMERAEAAEAKLKQMNDSTVPVANGGASTTASGTP